jgi:hypothetical protein
VRSSSRHPFLGLGAQIGPFGACRDLIARDPEVAGAFA